MKNQKVFFLLKNHITTKTNNETTRWIEQISSILEKYADSEILSHSIAIVPKKIGKDSFLESSASLLPEFRKLHPGWQPEKWSLTESIRILFNLTITLNHYDAERVFIKSYRICELSEKIAYLKGIYFYEWSNYHHAQALEAIRSNTRSLFAAVCQFNPYPAENFLEKEWNNMILKALTWDFSMDNIYGFDKRKNESLSIAVNEYITELSNADRAIPLDAQRCIG